MKKICVFMIVTVLVISSALAVNASTVKFNDYPRQNSDFTVVTDAPDNAGFTRLRYTVGYNFSLYKPQIITNDITSNLQAKVLTNGFVNDVGYSFVNIRIENTSSASGFNCTFTLTGQKTNGSIKTFYKCTFKSPVVCTLAVFSPFGQLDVYSEDESYFAPYLFTDWVLNYDNTTPVYVVICPASSQITSYDDSETVEDFTDPFISIGEQLAQDWQEFDDIEQMSRGAIAFSSNVQFNQYFEYETTPHFNSLMAVIYRSGFIVRIMLMVVTMAFASLILFGKKT